MIEKKKVKYLLEFWKHIHYIKGKTSDVPGAHGKQKGCFDLGWYHPVGHPLQEASMLRSGVKDPALQGAQVM